MLFIPLNKAGWEWRPLREGLTKTTWSIHSAYGVKKTSPSSLPWWPTFLLSTGKNTACRRPLLKLHPGGERRLPGKGYLDPRSLGM